MAVAAVVVEVVTVVVTVEEIPQALQAKIPRLQSLPPARLLQ